MRDWHFPGVDVRWVLACLFLVLFIAQRKLKLIERSISVLLSLRLVSVLSKLGPQTFDFDIRKGRFSLQDLHLKPEFVNSLDLPFFCTSAVIHKIEFTLPAWRVGGWRPALLQISHVELNAVTRATPTNVNAAVYQAWQSKDWAQQRRAKLNAVESLLWGGKLKTHQTGKARKAFKRHLAFQLARILDLQFSEVAVHVTIDRGLDLASEGPTEQIKPPAEEPVLGSVLSYRLRSFTISNQPGQTYGVLSTAISLQGLSIDVTHPKANGKAGCVHSVLRRWNSEVEVGWRLASAFVDRVAHRHAEPVLDIKVFAHALRFHFDPPSLKAVIAMQAHVAYYFRYFSYRMLRPQVRVDDRPQLWWQHAGRSVLQERAKLLGGPCTNTILANRRRVRQTYQMYYSRYRSPLYRIMDTICGTPNFARDALQSLENQLSDADIAQFRWWYWAHQGKIKDMELLALRLEELFQVISAKGKVRQKRSRPLRAKFDFSCPKISVHLHSGSEILPTIFEVALHELNSKVLAGSPNQQMSAGTGPVAVEASIAQFFVHHSLAVDPKLPSSSEMGRKMEASSPWLLRSPTGATVKDMAPNFVSFRLASPALQASEPTQVTLNVAEMDMVYSQYGLLCLVAFLDKASPPPNLDPLMLRATVTLHEIVRERLITPKRSSQLSNNQQFQTNIEATAGDVRFMIPCTKDAASRTILDMDATSVISNAFGLPSGTAATLVDKDAEPSDPEQPDPCFLVVILSGFNVSSQADDAQLRALNSGGSVRASVLGESFRKTSSFGGSFARRTTAGGDSSGSERIGVAVSAFAKAPSLGRRETNHGLNQEKWLRNRPGATFFEKLQFHAGFEAFLAKTEEGPLDFRDCAQVVHPVHLTTKVDHCVEPASTTAYRRVLQVRLTTSHIHVECSKFVKQQLHNLAEYMHSNLTDKEVTSTIKRHFKSKAKEAGPQRAASDSARGQGRTGHSLAPSVTFTDRWTMKRVQTGTTDLTSQPSMELGTTEDGEEVPDKQAVAVDSHYGLVLALQVFVTEMSLDLKQSQDSDDSSDYPELIGRLFRIGFKDLHTTLAIDEDVHDLRFAVGALAVDDVTEAGDVKQLIRCTPPIMSDALRTSRATLHRAFQGWRMRAAQKSSSARRAQDSMNHLLLTCESQLSGHIISSDKHLTMSFENSLLHTTLDIESMRLVLLYCCEIIEAKPQTCRVEPGTENKAAETAGSKKAVNVANKFELKQARSLTLSVHLQGMHLDVILEGKRFATVSATELDWTLKHRSEGEVFKRVVLRCQSFQVLDRLCASNLYHQAIVCDNAANSSPTGAALQVVIVIQNANHEAGFKKDDIEQARARSDRADSSVTAAQRLAKLSGGSHMGLPHGQAYSQQPSSSGHKKSARKQKKKCQPQKVVKVECHGLHATLVSRFVYDWQHFGKEVKAMIDAVSQSKCLPEKPDYNLAYRTITEVVLTEMRLDIPRHSWSNEFYSLACPQVCVAFPTTAAYVEQLKPVMDRGPTTYEKERARFAVSVDKDWQSFVRTLYQHTNGDLQTAGSSQIFSNTLYNVPSASDGVLHAALSGAEEHNSKFHHWHEGQDAGAAVHFNEPKLIWASHQKGKPYPILRQVWDGGDIVANSHPATQSCEIWCPWVRSIVGELQYELMLGIFWENMYERCSFGSEAPPLYPFGFPLPPAPPQARVLGVDKSKPPTWKFDFHIHTLYGVSELLPPSGYTPGMGPELGKVVMQDVHFTLGEWPCGSWDITVASKTLQLADTRRSLPLGVSVVYVVQIGESEAFGTSMPRLQSTMWHPTRSRKTLTTSSKTLARQSSNWEKVREAVKTGTGPFQPPHRLQRFASFAWDSVHGSTRDGGSPSHTSFSGLNNEGSCMSEGEEGFFLEYVIQAAAPATPATPALPGPHVMEIVLKGAQLTYPLATMHSFCHDIVHTYSHYVYPPWVSPYPQDLSPDEWMYANIICECCQLFFPLPKEGNVPASSCIDEMKGVENGLNFTWDKLRLGQFWGGDGECYTKFDADQLSASGHVDGSLHGQGLISPLKAKAELRVHTPKDKEEQTGFVLDVKSSGLEIQPSFGQMPLFHSAIRIAIEQAQLGHLDDKIDKTEMFLRSVVFRPSSQRVNIMVESLSVGLVDDRYGHHIKVLAARLQDVDAKLGRDYPMKDVPAEVHASLQAGLDVMFLNSAVDATAPLVEYWPVALSYRQTNKHHTASVHSDKRLNLVMTPASFRSLGDLYTFIKMVQMHSKVQRRRDMLATAKRSELSLLMPRKKTTTLYRIINHSGLKLSYWVLAAQSHLLKPFESEDLKVDPEEKLVIMPDSQQHVDARTICMQFEGNWSPVTDIIVDKVGKYAYTIGSKETGITQVVMDVALDIRTKVLTVHSPFRIENHTNHHLEFKMHLSVSPMLRNTLGELMQGRSTDQTVPARPLQPGAQCYLPVPAVWGGTLYLRAINWNLGEKDKIDLNGPKLKEKEGVYTCPALNPGQKPFHCCLKVRHELIKVFSKEQVASSMMPEYVMVFQPPLIIHNVLPFPVTVFLSESHAEQSKFEIDVGGFVEVYQFDLARKIRMSLQLQDFVSLHHVNIHYPPSSYVDDATRKSVIADIPGLRLAKQIPLIRRTQPSQPLGKEYGPQPNRLSLRINNKMDSGSRAREVAISCPYWIVNKTNVVLKLKDTSLNSPMPAAAPPGTDKAEPVLFSTARGSMKVGIFQGVWSRSINLESLGLHHNFHVLGPQQVASLALRASDLEDESIMHFDCEKIIAPRGQSPRRSRLVSRLNSVSRLDSAGSEFEREVLASPREVTDPGHVTASLNCATGGRVVSGSGQPMKRFEFTIETSVGPSIFHRTKVITILPRYVLFNNSEEALQYGQRGTSLVWQISPGARSSFHWDDADGKFELCIRPAIGKWRWSGAFQIGNPGDHGLRVYNPAVKQHRILPVEVSLNGGCSLITVGKEAEQPPYRIDNRCENVRVKFQQRDIDRDVWEMVEPGQSVDYAWEEPNMAHRLCVLLESENVKDNSEHEYNLDVIKAFPVVKLRRTKDMKIVYKVANTVGRVMTTGITMSNKNYAASQDQPDVDARYVYVGVHADGPTRVLCFSETRDEYTRGTNEESVTLLTQKLKTLDERNQEVDDQLKAIDEQQNIDISLAMGAPTARRPTHDQMDIAQKQTMRLGRNRTVSTEMAAVGSMVSISRSTSLNKDTVAAQASQEEKRDGAASTEQKTSPGLMRKSIALVKKVVPSWDMGTKVGETSFKSSLHTDLSKISESDGENRESLSDRVQLDFGAAPGSVGSVPDTVEYESSNPTTLEIEPHPVNKDTMSMERHQSLLALRKQSRVLYREQAGATSAAEPSQNASPSSPGLSRFGRMHAGLPASEQRVPAPDEGPSSMLPTPAEARQGSILVSPRHTQSLSPDLSIKIPGPYQDTDVPKSPYDSQTTTPTPGPGFGRNTMNVLRRMSLMRSSTRPRNANSSLEDVDSIIREGFRSLASSLGTTNSAEKEKLDEAGNPILGGELLVTIVDAQGLISAWRKSDERAETRAHLSKSATLKKRTQRRLNKTLAKGDVYCTVSCEGQTKRSAVAKGHENPVWKEDMAFKSVQITSELKVTLTGRTRLGTEVFLGEVIIPLREVEAVADGLQEPEARKYVLGRRNAREKISGVISLSCAWRVTPLDVVTMKVKQKQAEVDRKEEMLALLQEKYNLGEPVQQEQPESPTSDLRLYGLRANSTFGPGSFSHKSFRALADQDPDIKRIVSYRGSLSIKILEGKDINPPKLLHSFYTNESYIQVIVSSDTLSMAESTKPEKGGTDPKWNHMLNFQEVPLGSTITFNLMERRKLTADIMLGQAVLPAIKFRNCKPHYLWLSLKGRGKDTRASIGELHMRVQWMSDEIARAPNEQQASWSLEVSLNGVGYSLIEANELNFPREVMHALLEDIHADLKINPTEQTGGFSIRSMQIDNQLLTSSRPVVLSHDTIAEVKDESKHDQAHKENAPPFMEIKWHIQQHNSSIIYFKNVSFVVQVMDLVLEEEFLEILVHFFKTLPMDDIWQTNSKQGSKDVRDQETEISQSLHDVLDVSVLRSAAAAKRVGKKWYFEHLDIHGIKCNLTLIPKSMHSEDVGPQRARLTTVFGVHFMDINNVSLRINALQMRNAFVTWRSLLAQIYRHLFFQALHEVHKILGQVDILGSPIVLSSNVVAGVQAFFNEPLKARNVNEFTKGLAKGSMELIKFSAFGFLEAIGQLLGGVSKGMALMTMDQEYINRFRVRNVTLRQRLLQGVQAAGVGFYEGFIGVLRAPINGWEEGGSRGILMGVYMGGSGLVLKPVSGLLEFFSKSIGGTGEAIRAFGEEVTRVPKTRIRSPRQFMATGLPTGDLFNMAGKQSLMSRLGNGKFAGDTIQDYLQNKENKALIFTDKHLIYISVDRQEIRWSFSLINLVSVSTTGLLVLLHHNLNLPFKMTQSRQHLYVPVRKRVKCRTRDVHQSLLVKLNRAQNKQPQNLPLIVAAKPRTSEASLDVGDMHIMNAMPPTQSNVPTEKVLRPSTLVSGLKRMMSKDKTDSAPVSPLPSDGTSLDRLLPAPQTDEDDRKAGPSKKENKSNLKPEVTQTMPAAIGLKREVQADRSHQTIPEDDPQDEIRERLQSLKLAIKTLGHKKTSAAAALHTLHFIGMSCESLLAEEIPLRVKESVASMEFLCNEPTEQDMSRASRLSLMQTLNLLCTIAEEAVSI